MCRCEFARDLVHVAPGPSIAGHDRAHDRMAGFVEMLCGVLSWRRIATADVAAGHTLAQRYPLSSLFEAFLAWFIHNFAHLFRGVASGYAGLS